LIIEEQVKPLNKRLRKGESAAFVELYEQLGDQIYRYVYSQLKSQADAADVVQEVFVRLVKSHRALGRAENLKGYVFATARNEVIRWVQKRKPTNLSSVAEDLTDEIPGTGSFTNNIEGSDWIKNTLDQLEVIDREIVQLKIFSQLTFEEVAIAMKLKPSNVASRYRRAINKLEQRLSDQGEQGVPKTQAEKIKTTYQSKK